MNDLVRACADLRNLAKNTQDTRVKAEIYKTVIDIYCVIKDMITFASVAVRDPETNAISDIMERLQKLENEYLGTNDALVNAIRDHEERLSELEDNTGAAEALEKACKELEAYKPDIFETMNKGIDEMKTAISRCCASTDEVMNAFEAANGTDLESAQYDEESEGYKFSADEIAQKLNVLSQYCDVELKDTCTVKDIANFLEHVELDASGNVWLNLQVDERTIKRFRLNREAAGQITM